MINRDDLIYILKKGVQAPSADNMQPWKFRLTGNEIEFYITPSKPPHFLEMGYRTLYLSAGCVIENMRLAAANRGYQLKPSYFPDPSNPLCVAKIHFEQSPHPNPLPQGEGRVRENDDSVIEQRCTNRKFYNGNKKIDLSLLSKLFGITASHQNFKLLWLTKEHPNYSRLCRLIGAADQIRFENKKTYEDLPPTLRFNASEVEQTKDGDRKSVV